MTGMTTRFLFNDHISSMGNKSVLNILLGKEGNKAFRSLAFLGMFQGCRFPHIAFEGTTGLIQMSNQKLILRGRCRYVD